MGTGLPQCQDPQPGLVTPPRYPRTCPPAAAGAPPLPCAWGCAGAGIGAPSPSGPSGRAAVAQRAPRCATATGAGGTTGVVPSASAARPQPGGRGEQRGARGRRGGTALPSVPTHLPGAGVSQGAAVDLVQDVPGQHHLVHLRLAPREHLGDKDSAVHVPGSAAEPQLSPRDPARLPSSSTHDISPKHGMQGKATSWTARTGKAGLMGRKAPKTAPMLSTGCLFPFLGHFQCCDDQIPLQSGEEDTEFLPKHHPLCSAWDCLINTAHLKESG